MTVTLHLGVLDPVRYTQGPEAPRRAVHKMRKGKAAAYMAPAAGQETVYDVAVILEEKYEILQTFADEYHDEIEKAVAHSVAGAIETLISSGEAPNNPFAGAEAEITEGMKTFLDIHGMDGKPGVPTQAALKGVNHRLKRPNAKGNPARPSFIDTGTMQASYKAWIDSE